MQAVSSYQGPERRRHRVYVTKNSEYHFRDRTCVAVRDRRSGKWLHSHLAVRRRLSGGVHFHANGTAVPTAAAPGIGEALYFAEEGRELITSAVCVVERPERDAVVGYCADVEPVSVRA